MSDYRKSAMRVVAVIAVVFILSSCFLTACASENKAKDTGVERGTEDSVIESKADGSDTESEAEDGDTESKAEGGDTENKTDNKDTESNDESRYEPFEDKPKDFISIEGDKISGAWVVGGTGVVDPERMERIVPAYNGITEFKKFESVEEKDAVIRLVIFSDHGDGDIDIFKITYIGDNTFSIEVEGASTVQFNAVSEELFRAITEIIE